MTEDSSNNYLYIGKYRTGEIGYVGIGGVTRPYGGHNPEADDVLRNGEVWMTRHPFSSRRDAEMAESLLIQALTFATQHQPRLTNLAKVDYTKFLIPSLRYREGSLRHSDLTNSLIVKIRPGSLTGRTSPTAESDDFGLTVRCNRWWPLNKAVKEKRDIRYLVAVTSGVKPSRVIGVWETNPVSDWWREKQGEPQPREFDGDPWNGPLAESLDLKVDRWVATVRSTDSDINNWQGLEFDWEGYRPQNVGWSNDIR